MSRVAASMSCHPRLTSKRRLLFGKLRGGCSTTYLPAVANWAEATASQPSNSRRASSHCRRRRSLRSRTRFSRAGKRSKVILAGWKFRAIGLRDVVDDAIRRQWRAAAGPARHPIRQRRGIHSGHQASGDRFDVTLHAGNLPGKQHLRMLLSSAEWRRAESAPLMYVLR